MKAIVNINDIALYRVSSVYLLYQHAMQDYLQYYHARDVSY